MRVCVCAHVCMRVFIGFHTYMVVCARPCAVSGFAGLCVVFWMARVILL